MARPKNTFNAGDPILAEKVNENFEEVWAEVAGYDAVVAPTGSNYSTIGEALADGKKRIFVKNGEYTEAELSITNSDTLIFGESKEGVIITSSEIGGSSKAVNINADNVHFENLTIKGHLTDTTLDTYYAIYISKNQAKGIIFRNCNFYDIKAMFVYGNYSAIAMYNCILDATSQPTPVNSLFQDFSYESVVEGCRILPQKNSSSLTPVFNYFQGLIQGCLIEGDKISMIITHHGKISGCWIRARNCYLGGDGIYIGNYFDNNGLDPGDTTGMIVVQGIARFIGNNVYCTYYARLILRCESYNIIVCDNWFDSGKNIQISAVRAIFCNNIWRRGPTTEVMTLTLTGDSKECQVNENIIIGYPPYTPVITDNGTNNNKLNNILSTES